MRYLEETNKVKSDFLNFFKANGYVLEPSVALNSKIDPSVFVVGSCTNVFKPHVLNKDIANTGHALVQPAINSKKFPDFSSQDIKRFSSAYTNLGLLHKVEHLNDIVTNQYDFFTKIVGLDPAKLSITVNSNDKDFMNVLKPYKNLDIMDQDACRNTFGKCGDFLLTGRNIRFNYNGNNICVLSVYQDDKNANLAVESSSTIQIILTEKYSLKNTMCVSVLNDFYVAEKVNELKYYDCISTISEMLHSRIMPNSSHMDVRILKRYIKAVMQVHDKMNPKIQNYAELIKFYTDSMYKGNNLPMDNIIQEAFDKCH